MDFEKTGSVVYQTCDEGCGCRSIPAAVSKKREHKRNGSRRKPKKEVSDSTVPLDIRCPT